MQQSFISQNLRTWTPVMKDLLISCPNHIAFNKKGIFKRC